jgi:4-diphosphocytidyl-2-C-methyl-D-erythritol kinase
MSRALRATPAAKVNLALTVGARRADGLHEVATVMQRIDLRDRLELTPAPAIQITGFAEDTLVRRALECLADAAATSGRWTVRLEKAIPVGAGLGGGSADAAAALVLANRTLERPLPPERLRELAATVGSDVPFFVEPGPKLVEGAGERLTPVRVPQDFALVVAVPAGAVKRSTGDVYRRFDELGGSTGFAARRQGVVAVLASCRRAEDLARLPPNDLARAAGESDLPIRLVERGAFRADTSGAGPAVYGLFRRRSDALAAASGLPRGTRTWVVAPVW